MSVPPLGLARSGSQSSESREVKELTPRMSGAPKNAELHQIVLPDGVEPGETLGIQVPSHGSTFTIVVPAGAVAGRRRRRGAFGVS